MTTIIRQKLGSSRTRLSKKIDEIKELLSDDVAKKEIARYALDLEKKLETFRKHVNELETKVQGDETESERFIKDYDDYDEVINTAEEYQTKLEHIMKYEEGRRSEKIKKEEQEREAEFSLEREKLKVNSELEKERMKLLSQEKIEFERMNLEKLRIEREPRKDIPYHKETGEGSSSAGKLVPCIKLPKLELSKFDGNVLKWQEFWDSFEAMIHLNPSLQPVDKFNYLKVQLRGEAKEVISGLDITGSNYDVAVNLLTERYGKKHLMIDAHYSQLRDIPITQGSYGKLRVTFDLMEKHLRSLESLGENVNNNMIVSLVKSKLPKFVIARLEEYKDSDEEPWDMDTLRKGLKKFISAQEAGERQMNFNSSSSVDDTRNDISGSQRFQKKSFNPKYSTGALHTVARKKSCIYCNDEHWSDECNVYPDTENRKQKLRGSCFVCLKRGHLSRECRSSKECVYCKARGDHHRSLCTKQFGKKSSDFRPTGPVLKVIESSNLALNEQVIMQTSTSQLFNFDDETRNENARLLFDCGSQRTYISKFMADKLQLKEIGKNCLVVYTFGTSKPNNIETPVVELGLRLNSGFSLRIKANVVPEITGRILRTPINDELQKRLHKYCLADTIPMGKETSYIDLLVGNDYYADIISFKREIISDGLYLLQSKLGWILSGRTKERSSSQRYTSQLLTCLSSAFNEQTAIYSDVDDVIDKKLRLEDFWQLETIGIRDCPVENGDEKAFIKFNETVQLVNGRYHVTWPWRKDNPELPDNYRLAYGRLKSLLKKWRDDPSFLKRYDEIIKDQIKKGIVEIIGESSVIGERFHYLPHHAVISLDKPTTKLRVVYDGSAKEKKGQLSLNENLLRGPVMLEDLSGLLLRFRTNEIAMVADIEKAFLQVGLLSEDRDVTRFLWVKNVMEPLSFENLMVLRFTRVLFGVISSPFLLAATIRHHMFKVDTENARKALNDIYVDNLITGVADIKQATNFYDEIKSHFGDMSMNLREWGSNSQSFLDYVPEEDRMTSSTVKVLGMQWNMHEDFLYVPEKIEKKVDVTKRQILKVTASVFDPVGYFSPIVLKAKLLLQNLWHARKTWDEEVSLECKEMWKKIELDLREIPAIKIPRFIGCRQGELLCFCDASAKAYATCIYLRCVKNNEIVSNLVFSKSRVSPEKAITLPRLELLGVVIGVRCLKHVKENLNIPIKREILWTDSQSVLHWLNSKKQLPVFVKNRVDEIRNNDGVNYRYVNTKENPADLATRGKDMEEIRDNSFWWHGPAWITNSEDLWPSWNVPENLEKISCDEILDEKIFEMSNLVGEDNMINKVDIKDERNPYSPFEINESNYSSLNRLLRVTAYAQRFVKNLKEKNKCSGSLTVDEIDESTKLWIRYVQRDVMKKVKNPKVHQNNDDVVQLGLTPDNEGIIRCQGRLIAKTDMLGENELFPIFIPNKSYFGELLIKDIHVELLHSGTAHTLSHLRNKYWIPKGRKMVRSVILKCYHCRRYHSGPFKMPIMLTWPLKKVTRSSPFTYSGLDYIGPLYIRGEQEKKKVWIALFTCVAVRAIHLEVVNDMSAECFLLALRRFVSRRGKPDEIVLDNASQFKVAKEITDIAWKNAVKDESVYNYTSMNGITWKFITEFAPWEGGFYERLVGMVKSCIRKSIGRVLLTKDQLDTFITEVEAVINSRPLVYVNDDIESKNVITPGHFISMLHETGTPDISCITDVEYKRKRNTAKNLLESWKKGQQHLNTVWDLWKNEYLLSLRERNQTFLRSGRIESKCCPRNGQIVHLKDKGPQGTWKIGKIEELIISRDDQIRSAKVRLSSGIIVNRPLNLLYPLETSIPYENEGNEEKVIGKDKINVINEIHKENENENESNEASLKDSEGKPKRLAGISAREKLAKLLRHQDNDS